jgi:hypothetical protein
MKKFVLALITILTFALIISAQSPCPTVSVMGPSNLVLLGEPETFTVIVSEFPSNVELKYVWAVSPEGKLIEGQGTKTIKAVRLERGTTITATVEIGGLPKNCPNSASQVEKLIADPLLQH